MTALATDYRRILLLLVRQFSDATGWVLRFTPATKETAEAVLQTLEDDACCCWHTEVRDEADVSGYLHLDVPMQGEPQSSLESVALLAKSLAGLISEMSTAAHELDASARDLTTLVDLKSSVGVKTDLPSTLSELLRAAVQLTESRTAAFFLLNPSTEHLTLRAAYQMGIEQIPMHTRELRAGEPDVRTLTDGPVVIHREKNGGDAFLPQETRSALCVPVAAESVPLGTIWVYDRRARDYTDRQIHVLQSIAIQTANTLERMVLLRESETQHRISRDLRLASESQQDLSSEDAVNDPRFEIASHCVSANELGGDLCETIKLSENLVGITVGDASGHGIPAALVMASARGALRALQQTEASDVAEVIGRLNTALHTLTHSQHFMSLFYGVLDAERRTLTYSNAGHCNPLFVRGDEIRPLDSHGLLLGVLENSPYEQSTIELKVGDMLVFYSDGISEAMNNSRELFRSKGIISAIRECLPGSASDLLDGIWNRVEAHSNDEDLPDDRTLMVVKILQ